MIAKQEEIDRIRALTGRAPLATTPPPAAPSGAEIARVLEHFSHRNWTMPAPAELPAAERNALAAAQTRIDSVAREFGTPASAPVPGETAASYRARVLAPLQKHSPQFKNTRLDGIPGSALDVVEERILADAAAAARRPESHAPGTLIPVKSFENGREVTRFNGDPMAWLSPMMTSGAVGSFVRNPKGAEMDSIIDTLAKLPLDSLERLQNQYESQHNQQGVSDVRAAIQRMGAVQTDELARSGKLFKQTQTDPETGRVTHTFVGDPAVWLSEFAKGGGGATCRLDTESFTGANSPEAKRIRAETVSVRVRPGERVEVVSDTNSKGKK